MSAVEEKRKKSTRTNDGVFNRHQQLPRFPSPPSCTAVYALLLFSLELSLFKGTRAKKERPEGQEQLIWGMMLVDLLPMVYQALQTLQAEIKHS